MAAKVYTTPEEYPEPQFDEFFGENHHFDSDGYFKACDEHRQALGEWCRQVNREAGRRVGATSPIGKTISFPVADGRAEYMVYTTTPLALLHLDYGDGYQVNDIMMRGLRLSDVKEMVSRDERLAEMFGGR